MNNAEFAARGIEAAKAFMRSRDYEIEAVDWKCDAGQIDIVAFDPVAEMLVFAEVTTEIDQDKGHPAENLTDAKRNRFERIAMSYLKEHDFGDCRIRFDTLSLLVFNESQALLRHHINAFGGEPID